MDPRYIDTLENNNLSIASLKKKKLWNKRGAFLAIGSGQFAKV